MLVKATCINCTVLHAACAEVATEVLNRCTAANDMRPDDPNYAVTFDYEFLEDFRNDPVEQNLIARLRPSHIVASFVNR